MPMLLQLALLSAVLIGHIGLWVAAYNQMNAQNMSRWFKKSMEKLILVLVVVVGVLLIAARFPFGPLSAVSLDGIAAGMLGGYGVVALGFFLFVSLRWLTWKVSDQRVTAFTDQRAEHINLEASSSMNLSRDAVTRAFSKVPGNQIYQMEVAEKDLRLERWPMAWDGLRIAHLSDLHMTGHVGRKFFEAIVERTNRLEPDVIVITGDIVDKAKCLDWIEPVLSKLESRYGTYYVLGNHDQRIKDEKGLRKRLKDAGMIAVNGRWVSIAGDQGTLWLAGNELPWYTGAERVHARPNEFQEDRDAMVLLSHSPDQLDWAVKRGFDLMLAGHTHGGQIRFPIVGAIVSPSKFGVRFASGVFQRGGTLLHVSRGLSGVHPIRLNCHPELALLTVHASHSSAGVDQDDRAVNSREVAENVAQATQESEPQPTSSAAG